MKKSGFRPSSFKPRIVKNEPPPVVQASLDPKPKADEGKKPLGQIINAVHRFEKRPKLK